MRTPTFLALNPNGRIESLVDGYFVLPGSNAILYYLADGMLHLPQKLQAKARVMQWLFSEQYSYEPNIATVRHWPAHFGRDPADPPFLERRRNGEAVLNLMDGHLAERAFLLGDDYTIADIALYAYTHVIHEGGYHLADRPHLA